MTCPIEAQETRSRGVRSRRLRRKRQHDRLPEAARRRAGRPRAGALVALDLDAYQTRRKRAPIDPPGERISTRGR